MRDILITGTGRGLGMSLLQAHREQGDRVFGLTLNITPELKEIAETDDKVFAYEADISSTESIEMVMDEVAKFTSCLLYTSIRSFRILI